MLKRWMLLLLTGLILTQAVGCGKKNQESTEVIEESAVDNTTADSDTIQSEIENLPPLEGTVEKINDTEEFQDIVYEPAEISCVIPSGFVADKEEAGLYLHRSYPKDISTISYVISENNEDITQISQDDYRTMLEEDFYNAYGDKVEVSITQYDKVKVDGRPGLKAKLQYEFKGVVYEQLIYMIYNGDESHILTYTQEQGGKWMEKFEESGESIKLVPVE